MNNRHLFKFFVLLILVGCFCSGCSKESIADNLKVKQEEPKPVKVFKIESCSCGWRYKFPGVVKSSKEVKLSFRIGGPISSFDLEVGEKVEKGDIIALIDKRDYLVAIKTIKANLEASRAKLKDAELQYQRYLSLLQENAAPKAKFDQVEAFFIGAKASTKALEKKLEAAENSLKDTALKAPFTGFVNKLFAQEHETIAPGMPVVSIIDLSSPEVEFFVSENLVSKAQFFTDFSFYSSIFPNVKFKGKLKEIGEKSTGAGQTYPVLITVMSNSDLIKPGMSVMVESFLKNHNDNYFDIPISSVIKKSGTDCIIWKVINNRAVKTQATLIKILNEREARVKAGLEKGDFIITAGASFVEENQLVEIVDFPSKTNIGNEL